MSAGPTMSLSFVGLLLILVVGGGALWLVWLAIGSLFGRSGSSGRAKIQLSGCPKCQGALPEGAETCPACGLRLG